MANWNKNYKSGRTSIWTFIFMIIVLFVMYTYGSYFYLTRDITQTHNMSQKVFRNMYYRVTHLFDRRKVDTSDYIDGIKPAFQINK